LNGIALEKAKTILAKMLQDESESNPELDKKILDVIGAVNSKNGKVRAKDIQRVLKVCERNQDQKSVITSATTYLNIEFNKHDAALKLTDEVTVFDLVHSVGEMDIDLDVFAELDTVVDKIATETDIERAFDNILINEQVETSFWIISHLIDHPSMQSLMSSGKFEKISAKISEIINNEEKFRKRYAEIVGFLYHSNQYFANTKTIIDVCF